MASCAVSIGRERETVGIRAVSEEGSRQDFLRVQLNACSYLTVRVAILLLLETTDVVLDSSVLQTCRASASSASSSSHRPPHVSRTWR